MLERAVQFCLEIGNSGFELRGLRFGRRRSLTLDVNLGLKRQVRRLAFGTQLLELLLVLLELGDRLLGLVQLGFEGGDFLLRVRTDWSTSRAVRSARSAQQSRPSVHSQRRQVAHQRVGLELARWQPRQT